MPDKFQIKIDSIMGGHANSSHFAASDQFLFSYGIDPFLPIHDSPLKYKPWTLPSGSIRPSLISDGEATGGNGLIKWIQPQAKSSTIFVYDSKGSVYTLSSTSSVVTGLKDLNDTAADEPQGSTGNGMAYYDNYMYFARSTTVARYGPLNGTPAWQTDYWVTTLTKAGLVNTTYPITSAPLTTNYYPNHILHRHSDGALYITDVVDNQGTIHFIKTKKTTVEGDTDDGSTWDRLNFGWGLWPTAVETYGDQLVFGLFEGSVGSGGKCKAKIAFWDTTSENSNSILWVEYPDELITAITNVNGVLYFFSTNVGSLGFRIMQYVGGSSFKEVTKIPYAYSPIAGGVEGKSDRLYFASINSFPWSISTVGNVFMYHTGSDTFRPALFSIMALPSSSPNAMFMADTGGDFLKSTPVVGVGYNIYNGFATDFDYNNVNQYWHSQIYKIGRPFKITSIRIPLSEALDARGQTGKEFTVYAYIDNGDMNNTLVTTVNNTNYPGAKNIMVRPNCLVGENNFSISFQWTNNSTALCSIDLPIIIEYELLPQDD